MPHQPRSWPGTAFVAAAVTLLNWPRWQRVNPGLDPSWQAGLSIAFTRHMQWGSAIEFTYGPYGFAGFLEAFSRSTTLIAMCYIFVITGLLSTLLVAGLRAYLPHRGPVTRVAGLATAGCISWAVVALSWSVGRADDFAGVVGLGLAITAMRLGPGTLRTAVFTALGGLAGFTLLVKFDTGIVLVGLLALGLAGVAPEGKRLHLVVEPIAAAVILFALAWTAAGQSVGHLLGFARASVSLAVGYSSAMGGNLPNSTIAWRASAMGALTLLLYAAAFRRRQRREQLAGGLMLAGWGWAAVKDGFVSGDHFIEFFKMTLVAIAITCLWARPKFVYAGALILAVIITRVATGAPSLHPLTSVRAVGTEVADLVQPERFSALTTRARSRVLHEEDISPQLASRVGSYTVAFEPWDDIVAWADPELRWDPEPVLQSYSAYTAPLDKIDATFLASRRAPQRVLYQPLSFDHRDPAWDPPATMEALYCHYKQLIVSGRWLVLRHVSDRCGPPTTLGTVRARFGQRVKVPVAPGKMVVATFALTNPVLSKLEDVVLKPPAIYSSLWPARGSGPVRYRFLPGTAGDSHVLATPRSLGYPARFTPGAGRQLELSGGGWAPGMGSVTITFRALSMFR